METDKDKMQDTDESDHSSISSTSDSSSTSNDVSDSDSSFFPEDVKQSDCSESVPASDASFYSEADSSEADQRGDLHSNKDNSPVFRLGGILLRETCKELKCWQHQSFYDRDNQRCIISDTLGIPSENHVRGNTTSI